jgi:recombination protein RecR
MQNSHHDPVSKLIFELSKLPGIGEKTAARLSHFILRQNEEYAQALAGAILHAKQKTRLCQGCLIFTDINPCRTCSDTSRNHQLLCIVERPTDVFSIENSRTFRGLYHVLHGALSPLDGVGPEELKIKELIGRLGSGTPGIQEIILATNPSIEGEATALYLGRLIKPLGIKVTKLAHGLPVGGLLEYTDKQTIGKALENRMEIN